MARKRSPEHDWICRRCGCPCDPPRSDAKHIGGGQGMKACRFAPDPILRSVHEADIRADVAAILDRRRTTYPPP